MNITFSVDAIPNTCWNSSHVAPLVADAEAAASAPWISLSSSSDSDSEDSED